MSLTPPPGISRLDIWLFNLVCSDPQCGYRFKETLRRVGAHDTIQCPHCKGAVDLAGYKPEIEHALRMAAADDLAAPGAH